MYYLREFTAVAAVIAQNKNVLILHQVSWRVMGSLIKDIVMLFTDAELRQGSKRVSRHVGTPRLGC